MNDQKPYRPQRVADKPVRAVPEPEPRKAEGWSSRKRAPSDWTGPATRIAIIAFSIAAMAGFGYFLSIVIKSYGRA